jgi:hypothetical protein
MLTGIIKVIEAKIIATLTLEAIRSEITGMRTKIIELEITALQIEIIRAQTTVMLTKATKTEAIATSEFRRVKPDEFSVSGRVFIRHE